LNAKTVFVLIRNIICILWFIVFIISVNIFWFIQYMNDIFCLLVFATTEWYFLFLGIATATRIAIPKTKNIIRGSRIHKNKKYHYDTEKPKISLILWHKNHNILLIFGVWVVTFFWFFRYVSVVDVEYLYLVAHKYTIFINFSYTLTFEIVIWWSGNEQTWNSGVSHGYP